MRINAKEIKGIAFEAGGVRVLGYIPFVKELYNRGSEPKYFSGTSGGSIIASMLAFGYDCRKMEDAISNGVMKKMSPRTKLWNVIRRGGMKDSAAIAEQMDAYFKGCTFDDLDNELYVYAVNENLGILTLFSKDETPDVPVALAVAASCAIPVYYTPVQIGDFQYHDGGTLNPFPMKVLKEVALLEAHEILGLRTDKSSEISESAMVPKGMLARLSRMIDIMMEGNAKAHMDDDLYERVVRINDMGVKATEFDMSEKKKALLRISGASSALKVEWMD